MEERTYQPYEVNLIVHEIASKCASDYAKEHQTENAKLQGCYDVSLKIMREAAERFHG